MDKLRIKSKIRNFTVSFVHDFNFVNDFLQIPHYCVVVGTNVYRLYKKSIFDRFPKEKLIVIKLDEENKTIDTAINLYSKLIKLGGNRSLTLISFGGGINQDVTGFAASTLYRGINWIFVPTTLLAMADSAVGLKTSLNFLSYKNLLGTFYPPNEIFINTDFLATLETKDYASGAGEIIKLLLMKEKSINTLEDIIRKVELLNLNNDKRVTSDIIKEAMKVKLSYMENDEFDRGRRHLLNYGHELGHALEPVSNFQVPHGTAVVVGMIFANLISVKRGWLNKETFDRLNERLLIPHIKQSMVELKKEFFSFERLLENMKKDKKRIGNELVLVLPKKNMMLYKIQDLQLSECKEGLKELISILKII